MAHKYCVSEGHIKVYKFFTRVSRVKKDFNSGRVGFLHLGHFDRAYSFDAVVMLLY